jgi:hypothetical protein
MNSETTTTSQLMTETETPKVEVKIEDTQPGAITTVKATNEPAAMWQQYFDQVLEVIAKLPDILGEFFASYQKPLVTTGAILASGITLYVALAVLDAINDIPLLAPMFELIGLAYSFWFVNRYLLRAANRQELSDEVQSLKSQVFGSNSSNT